MPLLLTLLPSLHTLSFALVQVLQAAGLTKVGTRTSVPSQYVLKSSDAREQGASRLS